MCILYNFAAVEWGTDFLWSKDHWQAHALRQGKEHVRYRINTYRVLITRGREGLILYFPPEPVFDETYELMRWVGFVTI